MKAKQREHTPGPWNISTGKEYKIQGKGEQIVLLIGDDRRLIPNPDDAALIASAPDLLAACKAALEAYRNEDYDDYFHGEQLEVVLEKAIEKAEGGPHE